MRDIQEMVTEFHRVFGHPVADKVRPLDVSYRALREELIREEFEELKACDHLDPVGIADALGDLVYVIFGYAVAAGIPLLAVVEEIHRSNMTKAGEDGKPIFREDGKVLKGPNFELPNIEKVLGLC